jgi:hypothetical protein
MEKNKSFFSNKDFDQHVRILINPFNNLDTTVLYRRFLDNNIYVPIFGQQKRTKSINLQDEK